MSTLAATLANAAWRVACQPARRRLQRALLNTEAAQQATLRRILRRHSASEYGRAHGLRAEMSVPEFQAALPLADYVAFEPWIERMKEGESDVLCMGRPDAFERSSGSTSAAKYLPLTATLRGEFQEAVRAWMGDLFARHPEAMRGPAWWLISPLRQPCETTAGGIPVGLAGDDEYLGRWERRLARHLWAVPPTIAEVAGLDENLDWTLRFLLQAPELRLISVWNSSYLDLLWRRLLERKEALLRQLATGTGPGRQPRLQRHLRAMPERAAKLAAATTLTPSLVWPRLAVVSAWADAGAAADAARTQALFDYAHLQPKGLLATEGVVTIPWGDDGTAGVPALNSHFLEFAEWPKGPIRCVHELEENREYAVLLTTGGGLWRYRLGDLVQVDGWAGATPRLRLTGRCDDVCDLRGEKMHPQFVAGVLARLVQGFRLLAPWREEGRAGYVLFVAQRPAPSAARVDAALRENPHYAHARAAGQLEEVRVYQVTEAQPEAAYLRHCMQLGQRAGTIKATALHRTAGWDKALAGHFVEEEARV